MTDRFLTHFDIVEARKAFAEGRNVTETLRKQKHLDSNTSEIIETAYDLQAGSYIEHVAAHQQKASLYAEEIAEILNRYLSPTGSLLDIGTGELTTLSLVVRRLGKQPRSLLAFDISWSRIYKGLQYARMNMQERFACLTAFVADICAIPLLDKSVDVTTSSHALEPNGGRLQELLAELFRVTRDKLVLFEPSFERNSEEGRQRMERLGYIKGVESVVEKLGGSVIEQIPIMHIDNPLNPTVCFVIEPPGFPDASSKIRVAHASTLFSVPGTNHPMRRLDNFFFSEFTGLCYPVLKDIPILKPAAAILASALCGE